MNFCRYAHGLTPAIRRKARAKCASSLYPRCRRQSFAVLEIDIPRGNQLGPYLVTVDEVEDPYNLKVKVTVNGKVRYQGSTPEIGHQAEAVFAWIEMICPLTPVSVIGFGTIPDCTGLDHDDFLDPGDAIEISFERLGALRCRFAEPQANLSLSRWPVRVSLQKYCP